MPCKPDGAYCVDMGTTSSSMNQIITRQLCHIRGWLICDALDQDSPLYKLYHQAAARNGQLQMTSCKGCIHCFYSSMVCAVFAKIFSWCRPIAQDPDFLVLRAWTQVALDLKERVYGRLQARYSVRCDKGSPIRQSHILPNAMLVGTLRALPCGRLGYTGPAFSLKVKKHPETRAFQVEQAVTRGVSYRSPYA